MRILEAVLNWILPRISPHHRAYPHRDDHFELLDAAVKSLTDWKHARSQFNFVDPGLIDYMVYRLNAAERYYLGLLSLARSQGVKAWPDNLVEPVKNRELGIFLKAGIQNPESRIQNKTHVT